MIKTAIIDDQILLSKSLKYILEKDDEIVVVGLGETGKDALEICKKHSPDIILLDIQMPEMDGVEATRVIKSVNNKTKVLVLTTFENIDNIMESYIAGADGYIVKDLAPDELILAVKCVSKGLHVAHSSVQKIIIREFSKVRGKRIELSDKNQEFTFMPVELEVIKLVSQGKSNKEIADILCFSEGTIKNKVTALLNKLDLRDRTQLVIFAIENNLI